MKKISKIYEYKNLYIYNITNSQIVKFGIKNTKIAKIQDEKLKKI